MFRVDVISDPSAALAPHKQMWAADLAALTAYDVELIKPMALFAEHVSLRTFRSDMLALVESQGFQLLQMPMRRVQNFANLSLGRWTEDLAYLGIDETSLAPIEEVVAFRATADDSAFRDAFAAFAERHADGIATVSRAGMRRLRARRDALISPDLDLLVEENLLTLAGWATTRTDAWSLAWTGEPDFFSQGYSEVIGDLSRSTSVTMFEPRSTMMLGRGLTGSSVELLTPAGQIEPAAIAAPMLARLPGLSEVSMHDVLAMRSDFADQLIPFRAAMAELADDIARTPPADALELARELERRCHRDLAPAITELQAKARSSKFGRQLLTGIADDKGSLAGVTSSVVLAAGSALAGGVTLAPAIAAAAVPFVRGLQSTLKAREQLAENRLYFLYSAQNRLDSLTGRALGS